MAIRFMRKGIRPAVLWRKRDNDRDDAKPRTTAVGGTRRGKASSRCRRRDPTGARSSRRPGRGVERDVAAKGDFRRTAKVHQIVNRWGRPWAATVPAEMVPTRSWPRARPKFRDRNGGPDREVLATAAAVPTPLSGRRSRTGPVRQRRPRRQPRSWPWRPRSRDRHRDRHLGDAWRPSTATHSVGAAGRDRGRGSQGADGGRDRGLRSAATARTSVGQGRRRSGHDLGRDQGHSSHDLSVGTMAIGSHNPHATPRRQRPRRLAGVAARPSTARVRPPSVVVVRVPAAWLGRRARASRRMSSRSVSRSRAQALCAERPDARDGWQDARRRGWSRCKGAPADAPRLWLSACVVRTGWTVII